MKTIKKLSFFLLLAAGLNAQTSDNPWLISAGINAVSLQSDFEQSLNNNQTYTKDGIKGLNIGVPSLSVFRSVIGGLAVGGQFSLNNLKEESGPDEIKFFNIDVLLKYGFNRDGSVSPYLKGGWGFTSFDALEDSEGIDRSLRLTNTYFGGLGLNFKLTDQFSAFIETSYRVTEDRPTVNYLQHTLGIALGLGSGDSDKDGVSDKKDLCPDVPGLKEFEGCPDTDGDGVLDKDDVCPELAGPVENNGCPFQDVDGDGVFDKDDDCPTQAGNSATGCPVVEKTIIEALNSAGVNILFPADGFELKGTKVLDAVAKVQKILEDNPDGIVLVQGYASEDGSNAYNQVLSQKRAEAVKAKLIELGIPSARLEVQAFGESRPIVDKNEALSRAKSRRVEFTAKQ